MKLFDDRFHRSLHKAVPASSVKLFEEQLSYTLPQAQTAALEMQEEIIKRVRQQREEGEEVKEAEDDFLTSAVSHNLRRSEGHREWVPVEEALRGPAHIAKLLIRRAQEKRSTAERPYRLNREQLACVALFVSALQKRLREPRRREQAVDQASRCAYDYHP